MIKPTGNKIIVKRKEAPESTEGGILIQRSPADAPAEGVVVAVGPGKQLSNGKRRTIEVKVGDAILFGEFAGQHVEHEGVGYLVMDDLEVLAVLEGE